MSPFFRSQSIRISLSSDESMDGSQTQLIFHGTEKGEDHYAFYFDVTVNVSNFTDDTTYVTADVFILSPRPSIEIWKKIQLPVTMQVKPTAFRIVGKWWFWLLLVAWWRIKYFCRLFNPALLAGKSLHCMNIFLDRNSQNLHGSCLMFIMDFSTKQDMFGSNTRFPVPVTLTCFGLRLTLDPDFPEVPTL